MAVASSVTLDTGDMLRLRNDEDKELTLDFERRRYRIAPGKTGLVPFQLVAHFWGDPRSRLGRFEKFSDSRESGYIPKREDELKRLGGKYGTYTEDTEVLNAEEWPPNSPFAGSEKCRPHRVTIQTDDGTKIIPACFDTTGEAVYQPVRLESEDLSDEVAYRNHLEKQLDQIKSQLRTLQGQEDDAEVDAPSR